MQKNNRRDFLINTAQLAAASFLVPSIAAEIFAGGTAVSDATQSDWRFCDKCFNLFWDGMDDKGRCSAGEGHRAQGFNFAPTFGSLPEVPNGQINWRFCDKCHVMFFDGAPAKGRCPPGGGHRSQGFNFRLTHDVRPGPGQQGDWRFCDKCFGIFFNGAPTKGNCPAGQGHNAQGFPFVLPISGALPYSPGQPEEVHFRQVITTPSGTALGGFVDLWLRNNGTYKAHFHMHDSGAADYSFVVRAVFTATNGLGLALEHSGSVEGHIIGERGRNDEKEFTGSMPLIRYCWPEVRNGSFFVSKEYGTDGVIGFVQDIGRSIIGAAGVASNVALAAVISLGDEMSRTLNQSSPFAVIGGLVVLASGGSMVLAVTAGAAAGTVTKAMVKQRPMSGGEIAFAQAVFGGSLPPANRLILTNLQSADNRAFTIPGSGGDILLNIGAAFDNPATYVEPAHPVPGQLLIHELTHAWQIHNARHLSGWICSAVKTQAGNHKDSAYKYGPPGDENTNWGSFNLEQQASIVEQWFAGKRQDKQIRMDTKDPYFHFIRDNIRNGRA